MLLSSIIVGLSAMAVGTEATTSTALAPRAVITTSGSATTTASSSSTATKGAATTHSIAVGASGMVFEPPTIENASVGDVIQWRFYPTGHWIVRSEFKRSCIPYEDTGPNKIGFSSGAQSVATTSNNGPTFEIQINNTEPLFFYCAAPGSCTDYHMVGVINPNETQTYDIQLAYAKNASYQMTPGEAFPSETASSSSPSSSANSASGNSSGSSSDGHHSLSTGAIAGIAIGGAAVLILAATLLYLCGRRGGLDKAYGRQSQATAFSGPMGPMPETKYAGGSVGPRSPGQETFQTSTYSVAPSNDPYQTQTGHYGTHPHGVMPGSHSINSASPPPMSEYSQSLHNQHLGMNGMDGNNTMQTGLFTMPRPTYNAPVELPTSINPGNSPLPTYSNLAGREYSWAQGTEGTYGPNKP